MNVLTAGHSELNHCWQLVVRSTAQRSIRGTGSSYWSGSRDNRQHLPSCGIRNIHTRIQNYLIYKAHSQHIIKMRFMVRELCWGSATNLNHSRVLYANFIIFLIKKKKKVEIDIEQWADEKWKGFISQRLHSSVSSDQETLDILDINSAVWSI